MSETDGHPPVLPSQFARYRSHGYGWCWGLRDGRGAKLSERDSLDRSLVAAYWRAAWTDEAERWFEQEKVGPTTQDQAEAGRLSDEANANAEAWRLWGEL